MHNASHLPHEKENRAYPTSSKVSPTVLLPSSIWCIAVATSETLTGRTLVLPPLMRTERPRDTKNMNMNSVDQKKGSIE